MALTTFNDFSTTPASNIDVNGTSIQGTASVSNFDNALRELMAILRRDVPGLTLANIFTKTQTWTKGSDVASAAALTLGDGNYFDITGTTTVTSIATKGIGTVVILQFDGALILTHHATDLILLAGANIKTAAGDHAIFVEYAAGDWRCIDYIRASGASVIPYAPKGYANGLNITTNATDATNDLDFASGEVASDGTTAVLMTLASSITKRLDASWAVGTGNGMLDTGAVGNNVYWLYVIQRSDTLVVDVLASLSATAPTMPTSYDRKRLIGFVVRASGVNEAPITNIGPITQSPRQLLSGLSTVEFDIPVGVKRGKIAYTSMSTNGTVLMQFQLGTASAFVTTGYVGSASTLTNGASSVNANTGHPVIAALADATSITGSAEFILGPNNTWNITSVTGFSNVAGTATASTSIALSAPMTRVRFNLTSTTFDAGSAYVTWEF